jgi:hypothetical protein
VATASVSARTVSIELGSEEPRTEHRIQSQIHEWCDSFGKFQDLPDLEIRDAAAQWIPDPAGQNRYACGPTQSLPCIGMYALRFAQMHTLKAALSGPDLISGIGAWRNVLRQDGYIDYIER